MAASEVTSVLISSTSGSTGTGLKKCKPSTRLGFLVAAAIFMIGMLEVLDASTASGGSVMSSSSCAKILPLTASSSTTASITSWRSDSSASSVVNVSRASVASRSASESLPLLVARSSEEVTRSRPALINASVGS